MSTTARKYTLVLAADYLAADNDGPWKHEFVDGAVYAMVANTANHNLVCGGVCAFLLPHVEEPGQVFSHSMKLRVKTDDSERYYYPDAFVSHCTDDREPYFRTTARVVVEVLSPATERIDRTEKFAAYTRLPDLAEYALVSQTAIEVELFRRRTGWQREFYQQDNVMTLESVGRSTSVSVFYNRVTF